MKPLVLQMQAFGPFAHRQVIDFSELGAKTFFLIHGPTGSGKTSILDGMCFALFGDSSGGEREGRQMRSHHAEPSVTTEVSFDFALGADRYRVQRVPEHQRKALRGDGLVKQNQQAELWRVQGTGHERTEQPLASGWSKVTVQVVQLLGFESRQFRQVIMLPQGRFFEFLKSSSQDREKILQVLFGTELYKRIEESLKRAADEVYTRAKDVRTRRQALLEQAGAATEEELADRETQQREALRARGDEERSATEAAVAAEAVLTAARVLDLQFAEAGAADQALTALAGQESQSLQKRQQLQAARKAAVLRPLEAAWLQVKEALAREDARKDLREGEFAAARKAEADAALALAAARERAPEQARLQARISELEALRPSITALDRCEGEYAAAQALHAKALGAETQARGARANAVAALEQLQQDIEALAAPASEAAGERMRVQQLQEQHQRAQELARVGQQLAIAEASTQVRRSELAKTEIRREQAAARRREVFQQWMAGQAARISHALRNGESCPVCGSQEHPRPAHAGDQTVSDEVLEASEQQQELADAAYRAAQAAVGQAEQQLASLRGMAEALRSSGDPLAPEELEAQLKGAQQSLAKAEKAAEDLAQRRRRLAAARQAVADSETKLQATQSALLDANNTLQQRAGQREELKRAVPSDLAKLPLLEQAIAQAARQRDQLQAALQSAEALATQTAQNVVRTRALFEESTASCQQLSETLALQEENLQEQLRAAAFPDLQAYRLAKLDDAAMEALDAHIRRFDQELAAARERVERARAQVRNQQRPDLAARTTDHEAAQARRLAASNAVRDALAALEHTSGFVASLSQIAQEFRQLDERHAVLRSVSDLATGNNAHRMSFQRYVLATLLEEVLAATTLRLRVMSRGRYEIRRRVEATDARSAGGLDLEVFDHYTGSTRAVSTLSGGESFLASLALALGLSDVVQSYAGGTRLDAIFVDEGFGTLDPEALDFAIRTLKDLQQAGRMVGIISHVAELKEWIDARLELKPTQAGSRAAFVV